MIQGFVLERPRNGSLFFLFRLFVLFVFCRFAVYLTIKAMEKITLEFVEESTDEIIRGFLITQGEKYADGLCFEEALGLIACIVVPQERDTLLWLKTKEGHESWRGSRAKKDGEVTEVDFEEVNND